MSPTHRSMASNWHMLSIVDFPLYTTQHIILTISLLDFLIRLESFQVIWRLFPAQSPWLSAELKNNVSSYQTFDEWMSVDGIHLRNTYLICCWIYNHNYHLVLTKSYKYLLYSWKLKVPKKVNDFCCLASLNISNLKKNKLSECGWIWRIKDATMGVTDNMVTPSKYYIMVVTGFLFLHMLFGK